MTSFHVAGKSEILIEEGLQLPVLPPRVGREKVAVITQPGTESIVSEVVTSLKSEALDALEITVPGREAAKKVAVAESLYGRLADFGLSRHDTVVGIGGGSVTDLSGFIAGTWLRGVESVYVPTTLLGAVDASIGGKTGINLAGKNLVGVFWHPSRVVINLSTLEALPEALKTEGMAEIIKAGLIGDPALFSLIEQHGLQSPMEDVVVRSIAVKSAIVNDDEREHGRRAFLNLGHTIGHGVEYASDLSHGDSVALGLVAASRISEQLLGFSGTDRLCEVLRKVGLPTEVSALDVSEVLDLIARDKKRDADGKRMILMEDVGSLHVRHVDTESILLGLEAIGLTTR